MQLAAHKKRPPLHTLERLLLGMAGVDLAFVSWAFGGMVLWAQVATCVLSAVTLAVALLPRRYSDEQSGQGDFILQTWPRLLRFPLFWLGLVLLGYLILQSLNPAWVYQRNTKVWWMHRVPSNAWLPTSVQTPFAIYNLWRQFIIYASAWMTVCALWIGITRRRSLQILLGLLVGNALVLSIVGIIQRMSGTTKVLWVREFRGASSFASFVYQNHGGAYISLLVSVAFGLAVWHYYEGRRRMARSTPAAVWVLAALLLIVAVAFSFSRGAIITLGVFLISATIAFFLLRASSAVPSTTPRAVTFALVLVMLGCGGFILRHTDLSTVAHRFEELAKMKDKDDSYVSRTLVRERAARMLSEHWVRGTGAGSFRYLFPDYIKDSPYLYEGGRGFWDHAHIDWLEVPIDLGLLGVLPIAGGFGWCVSFWFRHGGRRHPIGIMLMVGLLQTFLHALIDFPFQNTAVLVTWWALVVLMLRWVEFEDLEPPASSREPAGGLQKFRV